MAQTTANADAALKEFYLPTMREQINNSMDILNSVSRNTEDIEGRRAVLSLHTGRSSGVGARAESGTLASAGHQRSAEERISVYMQTARIEVTVKAIKAMSSDEGSFTRAVDFETKGIVNDAKFDVSRQVFGTSDGVISACASETGNVITLATTTTTTQMRQFYKNMTIDLGTVADPTLKGSSLVITAVDKSALTLTVTGTISGAAVTTTDRVFRAGAGGASGGVGQKEITGLQDIVLDSGTLHNVNPTNDPEWAAYVNGNSGTNRAATDNLFETAMDEVFLEGGEDPDWILTSFGVQRGYAAGLKSQKRFDGDPLVLSGGFKAPSITTPRGQIAFMVDRFCPENTAYVLNSSHLIEFVLDDWDFMDEDGSVLSRVSNAAAYEAAMLKFHELATDKRNAHGVINDLTEG
jgi:hypothetical protein|tara:strand:- start:2674 stop:3900 length:1227 start_codon:yes stop_codon:yes gene_type:complete